MTGQELFYALSFVDEKYVAEAETARISKTPWLKYLSVAACLCIILLGVYGMKNLVGFEKMPAADAPAAMAPAADAPAADAPAADAPPIMEDAAPAEAERADEEKIPAGELHEIAYARLRVTNLNEEGSYEAIVEETQADTNLFEVGQQVTLVVDSTKVPGADAEVQNDLRIMHTDAMIEIENGAYDAGISTLYVSEIIFLCRGDH